MFRVAARDFSVFLNIAKELKVKDIKTMDLLKHVVSINFKF